MSKIESLEAVTEEAMVNKINELIEVVNELFELSEELRRHIRKVSNDLTARH